MVDFRNVVAVYSLGTPKITDFNDRTLSNQNIFWFQIPMQHSIHIHNHKCFHDLLENPQDFLWRKLFIFLSIVTKKITLFTILHNNLHLIIFKTRLVNLNQMRVFKFAHNFDFVVGFIYLEWVDLHFFESVRFSFFIDDSIDCTETSFTQTLYNLIVLAWIHVLKKKDSYYKFNQNY